MIQDNQDHKMPPSLLRPRQQTPGWMRDYECINLPAPDPATNGDVQSVQHQKNAKGVFILYPIQSYWCYSNVSPSYKHYISNTDSF